MSKCVAGTPVIEHGHVSGQEEVMPVFGVTSKQGGTAEQHFALVCICRLGGVFFCSLRVKKIIVDD
jgi:hypothetical protein